MAASCQRRHSWCSRALATFSISRPVTPYSSSPVTPSLKLIIFNHNRYYCYCMCLYKTLSPLWWSYSLHNAAAWEAYRSINRNFSSQDIVRYEMRVLTRLLLEEGTQQHLWNHRLRAHEWLENLKRYKIIIFLTVSFIYAGTSYNSLPISQSCLNISLSVFQNILLPQNILSLSLSLSSYFYLFCRSFLLIPAILLYDLPDPS